MIIFVREMLNVIIATKEKTTYWLSKEFDF